MNSISKAIKFTLLLMLLNITVFSLEVTFNPSIPQPIILPSKDTTFVNEISISVIVPEGYTTVFYTVDGSEPDVGPAFLFSIDTSTYSMDSSITLRAITGKKINSLEWEKGRETVVKFQRIAPTPWSDHFGDFILDESYIKQNGKNAYFDSLEVIIFSINKNDYIYFTTDGTTPDSNSTLYTEPFKIYKTSNIKVRAYRHNSIPSDISEREYIITSSVGIKKVIPNLKNKEVSLIRESYSINGKKLKSLDKKASAIYLRPNNKIMSIK